MNKKYKISVTRTTNGGNKFLKSLKFFSKRSELLIYYDHLKMEEQQKLTLFHKFGGKWILFNPNDYCYCRICSRKLTDPQSIKRKIGGTCWTRLQRHGWGHPALEIYKPKTSTILFDLVKTKQVGDDEETERILKKMEDEIFLDDLKTINFAIEFENFLKKREKNRKHLDLNILLKGLI